MGFFKTLITGYKLMFRDINLKHNDLIPRCFTGCGTGLMMIGSAVMAKTSLDEDVQKVIADANAAVDEAMKVQEGEKKPARVKRIFKAKAVRGWKMVKAYHKGIIMETVGAACVGTGLHISEAGKHTALKGAAALGAAFASYRAGVREDLGEEADLRYLTGRKAIKKTEKIDRKTGEVTEVFERAGDDEYLVKKDPNDFRFWFSRETCPSLWSPNYDIRKANLEWVECTLNRQYLATRAHGGSVTLNDMRREFGGLEPAKMDVPCGGIFGRVYIENDPSTHKLIRLHWDDDEDFMHGRTDSCWIIFDCDPVPITESLKKQKKFTQVEQ